MLGRKRRHLSIDRRSFLIGGGAGTGLLLAWAVWPRAYQPSLNTAPGETVFNAFLKIAVDGHVTVVVPQAEMGQGVTTSLPQLLADELGADWRTIAVEPAPISPLYANELVAAESARDLPDWVGGAGAWAMRQSATRSAILLTMDSSSVRAFEQRYREAGAMARALLCMAAGERWDADWQACDTAEGFVVRGADKLRFGELAEAAAAMTPPSEVPLRTWGEGKIVGQPVPRLDLPSKIDGTARFAGDVRLSDMLYASVRHGPFGDTTLEKIDRAKADAITGVVAVVENERWVAAVGTNWWAADRALDAMSPVFRTTGGFVDDASIKQALDLALKEGDGTFYTHFGDPDAALEGGGIISFDYHVPLAAHAPIEPLTATARVTGDRLEIWMPTQAPTYARNAVARATGFDHSRITLYPMLVGGGFGRKLETEAAEIAAILTLKLNRPVQLSWSRAEETVQDNFRPPAIGRMKARLGEGGRPSAWSATIAVPSARAEQFARLQGDDRDPDEAETAAVDGAHPAYSIPAVAVEHRPASIGVPTGIWRSGAHSYTAFFNECFVDELAREAGAEPLSYRMQMLGRSPRLARCLATAASLGNWQGGVDGSGQGIAAHSAFGSHIAMLAEVHTEDGGAVVVDRIVAVVDCGRVVHPDIVRQLIEGGIVWGLSAAFAPPIGVQRGLVTARTLGDLRLLTLAKTPDIVVELIENDEDPGGVGELGVPTVAPAVANAIFAATGKRLRSLPLVIR